jgi:tetratricopeptide (TPR) repeat protein
MPQNTFIGRKTELGRLDDLLGKAAGGNLQVAFIAGEAGAGKSSLVEEFIREKEDSDPQLITSIGICNAQTGSGDPYLPFRQVLTSLTTEPEEAKSSSETAKTKKSDTLREFVRVSSQTLIMLGPDLIGIFVPGGSLLARIPTLIAMNSKLSDKLADRVAPKKGKQAPKADPALDQEKIFEQYATVLKALSKDRTIILVIDDLQWADSGSLNLLFHLARQLKDSRILLLGTYRPDDVALGRDGERHPLESILNELKRYFGDIVVDLSKSGPDEGQAFTNALVDSEPNHLGTAFRRELFTRTDGHPLFTVELLRDLQESGGLIKDKDGYWIQGAALDWKAMPARVEGVIGERITRLPGVLHETLTLASVIGYEFTAQVVARVQKVQERDLVKDLSRELEKRYRLVFEQGEIKIGKQFLSSYRFSHALTQQYLYDELGTGERRMLHGEIAETLEALAGEAASDLALQLAHHYDEARNPEKAIPYFILAGDAAFAIYAQNEAIAAYTRALELGKDAVISQEALHHLYSRRGRALELNGQFEPALGNYADMLAAARDCKDRKMELDSMVATSTLYSTPTSVVDAAKGQALSAETLKLAEELGDQTVECRVLWNLLLANLQESKADQAIDYGERSLILARSLNLREQLAYTLSDLGWAYNVACRFEEAEARLLEGAGLWRELGNMPLLANNLNALLLNLVWSGKYQKALGLVEECLEISRATRNIWAQGWPHHLQGQIWYEYGEIDQALDELGASVRLAEEANTPAFKGWYGAILSTAYIEIGAVQKGMDLYRTVRVPNTEVPRFPGRTATLVAYALSEIATGQLDVASSTLDECSLTNSIWDSALKLAQCRLALARKDPAQAIAIADVAIEKCRQFGLAGYLPEALFLKGRALVMNGDHTSASTAYEAAHLAAESLGSRRLLWQILAASAEIEPDPAKCSALKAQARENIQFIADHISSDELRASFLGLKDVNAVML